MNDHTNFLSCVKFSFEDKIELQNIIDFAISRRFVHKMQRNDTCHKKTS